MPRIKKIREVLFEIFKHNLLAALYYESDGLLLEIIKAFKVL